MLGHQGVSHSLTCTVREGRLERAREFINSFGLSFSQAWSEGYVLLCDALKNKRAEVAKFLLTSGSKVNSESPLHLAVINGDIEIVEMILDKGANINAKKPYGKTPLHIAIENEKMEVAEYLLKYGADVDAKIDDDQDKNGKTALYLAVEKGYLKIVEDLLNYGANVNTLYDPEHRRLTPLHCAAKNKQEEIAQLLISHEADINAQDKNEKTPLFYAVESADLKITQLFLANGANVNAKLCSGITALHIATEHGCKEIVKVLLEYGAKVDSKNGNGITPLHMGAKYGYQEIIETILKFGTDINCRDKDGRTALHIAAYQGHTEVVANLLEYGFDINITSRDDRTALQWAMAGMSLMERPYDVAVDVLVRHIFKMKIANLYVSETNLRLMFLSSAMNDSPDGCAREIARMKNEKINNANISFYDILAKRTSSLAIYMRNENIVQVLKSDDYKTKFPIYASMIKSNFRQSMERKELLERGNNIFHFLFPELPYDCSEKIFSYLSDEDLRILIDACKPLSIRNPDTNINDAVITSNVSQVQYARRKDE